MGQVIRIIDGPLAPIPCVSERGFVRCEECVDETTCGTRQVMKKVRDAIAAILDGTTLADVQTQIARARLSTGTPLTYSI
jgi:DNA-binding IscR family transcriptional regulator